MEIAENCWQEPASCPGIDLWVVGTSAAVEDQRGIGSEKDQSSWQDQDQSRWSKIVVQLCEHHMRQAEVLFGQTSEVWADPEDNGLAGLEVAVAAANTAGMALVIRLISIFVPGSIHWLSLYP